MRHYVGLNWMMAKKGSKIKKKKTEKWRKRFFSSENEHWTSLPRTSYISMVNGVEQKLLIFLHDVCINAARLPFIPPANDTLTHSSSQFIYSIYFTDILYIYTTYIYSVSERYHFSILCGKYDFPLENAAQDKWLQPLLLFRPFEMKMVENAANGTANNQSLVI